MFKLRPVTPLSIIASNLERALTSIEEKGSLDLETKELLEKTRELANGIEPYLIDNTTQEEDALKKLAEETLKHDWQGSGPSQINSLEPEMLSGR